MKYILESDFDKIYDELSECYLTEEEAALSKTDSFKVAWFNWLLKHYNILLDLLNEKITFDTVYQEISSQLLLSNEVRAKESFKVWLDRKNSNNWLPTVISNWVGLDVFAGDASIKAANLEDIWFNNKGLYIIVHEPTNRIYIGQVNRSDEVASNRPSHAGITGRMHEHYRATDSASCLWHQLIARNITPRSEYKCAILKITDTPNIAEKTAIGTSTDFDHPLGNIFDFNAREGGTGGKERTSNRDEVIERVKDLIINGYNGEELDFQQIADIINSEFEFPNGFPYTHKLVSALNTKYNLRSHEDIYRIRSQQRLKRNAIKNIMCAKIASPDIVEKSFTDSREAANWLVNSGISKTSVDNTHSNLLKVLNKDAKDYARNRETAYGYIWSKVKEN